VPLLTRRLSSRHERIDLQQPATDPLMDAHFRAPPPREEAFRLTFSQSNLGIAAVADSEDSIMSGQMWYPRHMHDRLRRSLYWLRDVPLVAGLWMCDRLAGPYPATPDELRAIDEALAEPVPDPGLSETAK